MKTVGKCDYCGEHKIVWKHGKTLICYDCSVDIEIERSHEHKEQKVDLQGWKPFGKDE